MAASYRRRSSSRIALRPGVDRLPLGIGRERVLSEVRAAADATFREQLRASGLEDVRRTERGTVRVTGDNDATEFRYAASAKIDGAIDDTPERIASAVEDLLLEAVSPGSIADSGALAAPPEVFAEETEELVTNVV